MKKITAFILSGLLLASGLPCAQLTTAEAESSSNDLRILFTHDLHDHILPYKSDDSGTLAEIGGYAGLKAAIDANRTDSSLLLDAGDFSMGTLFNGIYAKDAPDLSLLGAMGYDAVTFGNHEFDYGPEALAEMIGNAQDCPQLLSANINFAEDQDSQTLKAAFEKAGGKGYVIKDVGGVKVGLFGVMGEESESDIAYPGSVTFDDEVEVSKTVVAELKSEGAQFIVAISHSGTNSDSSKSEDEILAKSVDGINVIISGHSHTTLSEPLIVNGTAIVSCGCYGKNLGVLDVNPTDGSVISYSLVPITAAVGSDAAIEARISAYKEDVQKTFLDQYGLKFDDVIVKSGFTFQDVNDSYDSFGNYNIADLITDSYVDACEKSGTATRPIGVGAKGIIRDDIFAGDVTLSDVYNVVSLGQGEDDVIGYPLAVGYVYGSELRQLCEIDCSLGRIRSDAQLFFSGMKYTYSDTRLILNRVEDVYIENEDGSWSPVKSHQLYPVVCNLYMAMMMPSITKLSRGLLSITIKDSSGQPISDLSTIIMHDSEGKEVKEWSALVSYLKEFGGTMPDTYRTAREGKTEKGFGLKNNLKNTSKFGWIAYGVFAVLVLLIIGIVKLIKRRRRRRREKSAQQNQNN
jgi:2',3'-cyclic-nucleotide 2'-phosphodiesterase (5'-nucleotidase family)